jgi:hypothetical protein
MDPMERLIAADPLPEGERLTDDEQASADAMLAWILSDERKPARRPRRHWALAIAATAAAIVLALVAIDVADEDAPGPNVVERAVAAVSVENSIYHTFEVVTVGDLRAYRESWFGPGASRQKISYKRGKLAVEEVLRPPIQRPGRHAGIVFDARRNLLQHVHVSRGGGSSGFPEIDPSQDPAAALKGLRRQGRLRLLGSEELDGRKVYRLVGDAPHRRGIRVNRLVYLVDAKTYYPVRWQWVFARHGPGRVRAATRFTTYERLPATAENRKLLKMDRHPGATVLDRYGKRIR